MHRGRGGKKGGEQLKMHRGRGGKKGGTAKDAQREGWQEGGDS